MRARGWRLFSKLECVPAQQTARTRPPLQATVVAMQGAAARWQAQAGEVEQGLALLRFR